MSSDALGAFDYVIVGGGTAGSVLAARLAELTTATTCLIEAGPADERRPEILEVQRWPELLGSQYDYDYAVEPQQGMNGDIRHSRARVLGGCSSHNVCAAWRAPDHDLERWVDAGAHGWGPADLEESFDRVVARVGILPAPQTNAGAAAFIEAAARTGLPVQNWGGIAGREGAGWVPTNAANGLRRSSSVAYLHPLASLPRTLTVMPDTVVHGIRFDGRRAVGVDTSRGMIRARVEVIVCAGALDSPKLLLLSGIGPAAHLRSLGIPVVADLPTGRRLMDHPEGVVIYETLDPIHQPDTTWVDAVAVARTGASADPYPDTMIWFFSGHFDGFSTKFGTTDTATMAFTLGHDVLYAKSEGSIELRSSDPAAPPRIELRYFTDPEGDDARVLLAGLKLARRIAAEPPLRELVRREISPGAGVVADDDLLVASQATAYTAYHPTGTCRIGAVVDPSLRVYGVDGLRVADASIFPAQIGVNPCITCMAIGDRCAQLIATDLAGNALRDDVVIAAPGRSR